MNPPISDNSLVMEHLILNLITLWRFEMRVLSATPDISAYTEKLPCVASSTLTALIRQVFIEWGEGVDK